MSLSLSLQTLLKNENWIEKVTPKPIYGQRVCYQNFFKIFSAIVNDENWLKNHPKQFSMALKKVNEMRKNENLNHSHEKIRQILCPILKTQDLLKNDGYEIKEEDVSHLFKTFTLQIGEHQIKMTVHHIFESEVFKTVIFGNHGLQEKVAFELEQPIQLTVEKPDLLKVLFEGIQSSKITLPAAQASNERINYLDTLVQYADCYDIKRRVIPLIEAALLKDTWMDELSFYLFILSGKEKMTNLYKKACEKLKNIDDQTALKNALIFQIYAKEKDFDISSLSSKDFMNKALNAALQEILRDIHLLGDDPTLNNDADENGCQRIRELIALIKDPLFAVYITKVTFENMHKFSKKQLHWVLALFPEHLEELHLSNLSLKNLNDCWMKFKNLRILDLSHSSQLYSIFNVKNLSNLTNLNLQGCSSLKNIQFLSSLSKLQELDIFGCPIADHSLEVLEKMNLENFVITYPASKKITSVLNNIASSKGLLNNVVSSKRLMVSSPSFRDGVVA